MKNLLISAQLSLVVLSAHTKYMNQNFKNTIWSKIGQGNENNWLEIHVYLYILYYYYISAFDNQASDPASELKYSLNISLTENALSLLSLLANFVVFDSHFSNPPARSYMYSYRII